MTELYKRQMLTSPDSNGNKKIPSVLGFFYCNG